MPKTKPTKKPDGNSEDEISATQDKRRDTIRGCAPGVRTRSAAQSPTSPTREAALRAEGEAARRRMPPPAIPSTSRDVEMSSVPPIPAAMQPLLRACEEPRIEQLKRCRDNLAAARAHMGLPPPADSSIEEWNALIASKEASLAPKEEPKEKAGEESDWSEYTAEETEQALKAPKRKRSDNLPSIEEIKEELRTLSTPDLVARTYELQDRVCYIADHSSNLKGNFKRDLRLCSKVTKAVNDELHARSNAPLDVRQLRLQNVTLEMKVSEQEVMIVTLKTTVEQLRAQVARMKESPHLTSTESHKKGSERGSEESTLRQDLLAMEERITRRLTGMIEGILVKSGTVAKAPTTMPRGTPTRSTRSAGNASFASEKGPPAKSLTFAECVRRGLGTRTKKGMATSTPYGTDSEEDGEWRRVRSRPRPLRHLQQSSDADATTSGVEGPKRPSKRKAGKKGKPKVGRIPKTAAVTVSLVPGTSATMADTIKYARENIMLEGFGIGPGELRPKRAITGAMILEVLGENNATKASALATSMRALFQDRADIKITVPQKMSEVRVTRIDDSVTPQDIAAAIAATGGCDVAEVKVGNIKSSPYGMGTAWVKCPVAVAKKIVALERLLVGWSATIVTPLEARPLQCYKCLEFGHVKIRCPKSDEASTPKCFRCGKEGHLIAECKEEGQSCIVCKKRNYEANHRIGGPYCRTLQESRRRSGSTTLRSEAETTFKKPMAPALKAKKKKARALETLDISSIDKGELSMDIDA